MFKTTCEGCYYYVANGPATQDGVCRKNPPDYDAVFRLTRYTPIPGNWMACGCYLQKPQERSLLTDLQQRREAAE